MTLLIKSMASLLLSFFIVDLILYLNAKKRYQKETEAKRVSKLWKNYFEYYREQKERDPHNLD